MTTQVTKLELELLQKVLNTDCAGFSGATTADAYALDVDMDIKKVTGLMMSLSNKGVIEVEDMSESDMDSCIIFITDNYTNLNKDTQEYSLNNITL